MPRLPDRGGKRRRQIAAFTGLDLTARAGEGALRDSLGLTARNWPCLTARPGRTAVEGLTDPTDLFVWDGHLVVVDGSVLTCDGEPLDNVLPGRKQFAVVNTKLCVWPDKTYIDLTNGSYGRLDAGVTLADGAAGGLTVTENVLTAAREPRFAAGLTFSYRVDVSKNAPSLRLYGADGAALRACWRDGAWDRAALAALSPEVKSFFATDGAGRPAAGDLFLPVRSGHGFTPVLGDAAAGVEPGDDATGGGYYAVVTSVDGPHGAKNWKDVTFTCDVYRADGAYTGFADLFRPGDRISVTGTRYGLGDADKAALQAVDGEANALTFPAGTFPGTQWAGRTQTAIPPGASAWSFGADGTSWVCARQDVLAVPAGGVLYLTRDRTAVVWWDPEGRRELGRMPVSPGEEQPDCHVRLEAYDPGYGQTVDVRRPVPDLDFICSSGNRLWGVSNRQTDGIWDGAAGRTVPAPGRVIYASALGDPAAFWTFDGVSTDSWQAAVGSPDDFTAVCAWGGGVCCWKERLLHKVTGSWPAEYCLHDYPLSGPRPGAERSLAAGGGTLYYLGRDGAYAWAGGTAERISGRLGTLDLAQAAGCADGGIYYLSGVGPDGTETLLTYETSRGVWLREDDRAATAFARTEAGLYLLSGGSVWLRAGRPDEETAWMAELAPFEESPFAPAGHSRLLLRLDTGPVGWAGAEISRDGGLWRQVWLRRSDGRPAAVRIPIPMGRCASLRLRLSGRGDVTIRAVGREWTEGSDHGRAD